MSKAGLHTHMLTMHGTKNGGFNIVSLLYHHDRHHKDPNLDNLMAKRGEKRAVVSHVHGQKDQKEWITK